MTKQKVCPFLYQRNDKKREKDCLWKQRAHYGLENGRFGMHEQEIHIQIYHNGPNNHRC